MRAKTGAARATMAGLFLCAALGHAACSDEGKDTKKKNGGSKSGELTKDPGKGGNTGKDKGKKADGSPKDEGGDNAAGAAFFAETVVPQFKKDCVSCHADPRFRVETQGPLSIFSYDAMRPDLLEGSGPEDNALMDKVAGRANHVGGNRCPQGTQTPACQVIAAWHAVESGKKDEGGGGAGFAGELGTVGATGQLSGWAVDRNALGDTVTVAFFVDVTDATGTPAFELKANQSGYDGNSDGDHAFAGYVPAALRDGKQHMLYAYAMGVGQAVPLKGSPQAFTAYAPKAAGKAYYDATLKPLLTNRCGGCHAIAYETQWANLVEPSPAKGGTATNNILNRKPSAAVAHGGGNVCGGATGNPCAQIQEWWRREFGP